MLGDDDGGDLNFDGGRSTGPARRRATFRQAQYILRVDPDCIGVFYRKKNLRACRFYYVK
jgi:hypothetical protein